jgi:hypothetical protein
VKGCQGAGRAKSAIGNQLSAISQKEKAARDGEMTFKQRAAGSVC